MLSPAMNAMQAERASAKGERATTEAESAGDSHRQRERMSGGATTAAVCPAPPTASFVLVALACAVPASVLLLLLPRNVRSAAHRSPFPHSSHRQNNEHEREGRKGRERREREFVEPLCSVCEVCPIVRCARAASWPLTDCEADPATRTEAEGATSRHGTAHQLAPADHWCQWSNGASGLRLRVLATGLGC
jgi:hypothetical protein